MKNKELNSLIVRLKSKENNAFEELYNELWDVVYYIAYRYLGNGEAAKDITQETFTIIYQKIDKLVDVEAFNTWMYRIVINLCNQQQNLISKESFVDITDVRNELREENVEFLPEELLHDKNRQEEVLQEVTNLPIKLRGVMILYYFEDMTIMDIAKTLDIAVGTVHHRLVNGRQILSTKFDKESNVNYASTPIILTMLFQQDKEFICTSAIKESIKSNIRDQNINTSSKSSSITSMMKILFVILILGAGAYGVLKIFINKPPSNNDKTIYKEDVELTLKTFVGADNSKLINSWNVIGKDNNNKLLVKIIEENRLNVYQYYIDPNTDIMYVIYKKDIKNISLFLGERYDANSKEWNVVYQILESDTKIDEPSLIIKWFEQLE